MTEKIQDLFLRLTKSSANKTTLFTTCSLESEQKQFLIQFSHCGMPVSFYEGNASGGTRYDFVRFEQGLMRVLFLNTDENGVETTVFMPVNCVNDEFIITATATMKMGPRLFAEYMWRAKPVAQIDNQDMAILHHIDNTKRLNILVTGAAGFIGSYLCEQLLQSFPNAQVIGFDVLAYCASKENLSEAVKNSRFSFVRGDICNEGLVRKVLKDYDVRIIVHCAAESHVDNSFGNSLHFTEVNVRGTHIMLECAKALHAENKLVRFLHVSTDEVYGTTSEGELHDELCLLSPTNPYSASKAAAEMYVRAYYKSYGLQVLITRSNNIYGPRQHPEKVIPRFVQRALRGNTPKAIAGPERTFLYVTDVANAIATVLLDGTVGETYNIGCENKLLITDLARQVVEMANKEFGKSLKTEFATTENDRPFNDERYRLDWSKITQLGWKPLVPFEQGLREIFKWHQQNDLRKNHWNDCEWLPLVCSP